jgi:hypothetical protein
VGTETAEISPGLTLTPKAAMISLTIDLATRTGISAPPVTSIFLQIAPTFSASCLGPVVPRAAGRHRDQRTRDDDDHARRTR